MPDRENQIRERAYFIWESEGRGDGAHLDHWLRAEKHVDDVEQAESRAAEEIIEAEQGSDRSAPLPTLTPPD